MTEKKKKEPYDQKTANLTPEEQEMRKENLEHRKKMPDDAVRNLCAAICLSSCHEYRVILRRIRAIKMSSAMYTAPIGMKRKSARLSKKDEEALEKLMEEKKELEDFFESDMFALLTGVGSKEEAIRKITSIPDGYEHMLERRMMA